MKTAPLSLNRFRSLLAAYGGKLECWPEAEQAGARALLQSSEEARDQLMTEQPLDAWLEAARIPPLAPELKQRLATLPTKIRPLRRAPLPRRALLAPGLGWAAAAVFGVWLGAQGAPEANFSTAEPDATWEAEESLDSEEAQLFALAGGALDDFQEEP